MIGNSRGSGTVFCRLRSITEKVRSLNEITVDQSPVSPAKKKCHAQASVWRICVFCAVLFQPPPQRPISWQPSVHSSSRHYSNCDSFFFWTPNTITHLSASHYAHHIVMPSRNCLFLISSWPLLMSPLSYYALIDTSMKYAKRVRQTWRQRLSEMLAFVRAETFV